MRIDDESERVTLWRVSAAENAHTLRTTHCTIFICWMWSNTHSLHCLTAAGARGALEQLPQQAEHATRAAEYPNMSGQTNSHFIMLCAL
jgi:hypothetical protein